MRLGEREREWSRRCCYSLVLWPCGPVDRPYGEDEDRSLDRGCPARVKAQTTLNSHPEQESDTQLMGMERLVKACQGLSKLVTTQ